MLDHTVEQGNPADAPQLAPAVKRVIKRAGRTPRTVTADRGYGEAARRRGPARARRPHTWSSPAKANPAQPDEPRNTDQRSDEPSNGEPAAKAGSAPSNADTAGTEPASTAPKAARIWTGHGVLAHNLVKINGHVLAGQHIAQGAAGHAEQQ